MSEVRVAACETMADWRRLMRESAARRKAWSQPKQAPPLPPPPPPPKESIPEIIPLEPIETAVLWMGRSATAIWAATMAGRRQLERSLDEAHPRPELDDIIRAVARAYGFRSTDLKAARQERLACHARHVSMLICKLLTVKSYPAIGRAHGGRDHTTVLHGVRKLAWLAPQLTALRTIADPPGAWAASAAGLHPLPALERTYERRPEMETP